MFTYANLPPFVDEEKLYALVQRVLELAEEELRNRGFGEERFLRPLFRRVAQRTNPARQMLDARAKGISIEQMMEQYGVI